MPKRIKDAGILEGAIYKVYVTYRDRDKQRGLEMGLTLQRFRELIFSDCIYCGGVPDQGIKTPYMDDWYFMRNTIDRIDSKLGYTEENSVPCCLICNTFKSSFGVYEWLQWVHAVAKHTKDFPGLKESPPFARRQLVGRIQLKNAQQKYVSYLAYNRKGDTS